MDIKKISHLLPIFSRFFVYGSGFLLVIFLSFFMSVKDFGTYSTLQSLSEFLVTALTFGAAGIYTKISAGNNLYAANSFRTSFILLPVVIVLALSYSSFNGLDIGLVILVLVVCFFQANNILNNASLLGVGKHEFPNIESGVRSTIVLIFLLSFYYVLSKNSIYFVYYSILFSTVISTLILFFLFKRHAITLLDDNNITRWVYCDCLSVSVFSFISRKADILILALYFPLEFIASFKILFLFSEIPQQISQAMLNSKVKEIYLLKDEHPKFSDIWKENKKVFFMVFVFSFLLFIVYSYFKKILTIEYFINYFAMSVYFFFRAIISHIELYLTINGKIRPLSFLVALEGAIKVCILYALVYSWPDFIFITYPIVGIVSYFFVYELFK